MHIHRRLCTSGVIYIYMLMTLCMYYPAYDVIIWAMCTMVLWHIWRCYVWYICYIIICYMFFTHCMLCTSRRPPITIPIRFLLLALSWCIFKLIILNKLSSCTQFLLTGAQLQQLCCRWPRCQRRYPTACGDCCRQLPLPGHLYQITYFYYKLCTLRCPFLIFSVFNIHRKGLRAISTCERSTGHHLPQQVHYKRRSTIISLKEGTLEEIIAER